MSGAGGIANACSEAGAVNWGAVLQGGQPITFSCPSGTGRYGMLRHRGSGSGFQRRMHTDSNGQPSFFGNPAAFTQPCVLAARPDRIRLRCQVAFQSTAASACWVVLRPRLPDRLSNGWTSRSSRTSNSRNASRCNSELSSSISSTTRTSTLLDSAVTALYAISGAANFTSSNFGEMGSTRDAPYDPRQIQLALKLYSRPV